MSERNSECVSDMVWFAKALDFYRSHRFRKEVC